MKRRRVHDAADGVVPAQQRLDAEHAPVSRSKIGWYTRKNSSALDRGAQVELEREPVLDRGLHLALERDVAVAAGGLRLVQRDVGVAQQVGRR